MTLDAQAEAPNTVAFIEGVRKMLRYGCELL